MREAARRRVGGLSLLPPLKSGTRWAQKQIEFVPFPLSSRWQLAPLSLSLSLSLSLHHYHHHHLLLLLPHAVLERVAISRLPARSNRRVKKREERRLLHSLSSLPSFLPSFLD